MCLAFIVPLMVQFLPKSSPLKIGFISVPTKDLFHSPDPIKSTHPFHVLHFWEILSLLRVLSLEILSSQGYMFEQYSHLKDVNLSNIVPTRVYLWAILSPQGYMFEQYCPHKGTCLSNIVPIRVYVWAILTPQGHMFDQYWPTRVHVWAILSSPKVTNSQQSGKTYFEIVFK